MLNGTYADKWNKEAAEVQIGYVYKIRTNEIFPHFSSQKKYVILCQCAFPFTTKPSILHKTSNEHTANIASSIVRCILFWSNIILMMNYFSNLIFISLQIQSIHAQNYQLQFAANTLLNNDHSSLFKETRWTEVDGKKKFINSISAQKLYDQFDNSRLNPPNREHEQNHLFLLFERRCFESM